MSDVFPIILSLPATILVAMVVFPSYQVNSRIGGFRRLVTLIAGLQFVVAGGFALAHAAGWIATVHWVPVPSLADAFTSRDRRAT